MKKAMSAFFAVALTAAGLAESSADVLVWYIDTTHGAIAGWEPGPREFDTIKFWAVDVETNERIGLGGKTYAGPEDLLAGDPAVGSGDSISVISAPDPTTYDGGLYTDLSEYDIGYTFLAEVYITGNGDPVDRMLKTLTWADLQEYMVSSTDLMRDLDLMPSHGMYNMASTMVPEPSSGLLLVIGGALLVLRRRRVW